MMCEKQMHVNRCLGFSRWQLRAEFIYHYVENKQNDWEVEENVQGSDAESY
jgi:hypothetical protein